MPIAKKNTRINIVISKEKKDKLSEIAKQEGKSVSGLVSKIVSDHLEKLK